ncbi:hypothetical protein [Pollutimonas harenae]|uniref:Uncharacterized protein n=1 Tax=Pollutimonas harenae TaxID=657015 RepID=A0A853GT46_9BURK|nr:hypothetical protein [Pollutimonas harenae]NYT85337.1 hypothetical protein [Pollutimonas harenae]
MQCAGLACLLIAPSAHADSSRLRELAPVRIFAAPQIDLAPPVSLPGVVVPQAMDNDETIFTDEADSIPDISYSFSWSAGDSEIWRNSDVSPSSPGLWGALSTPRGRQFTPSSIGGGTPWTLGTSNWSFQGDDGLDLALGSNDIVAPAWGSSARLGGISISQSSQVNAEDVENNWQYALSIGALDYSSGSEGDLELGPTAANSVFRYGVSPSFVLESQMQLAPNLVSSGLGGQYRTSLGNWSAGLARARVHDDQGWRYQAAYEVDVFEDLRLSWLGEYRDPGYADLSRYTADPSVGGQRQRWMATIPMGRWGNLSGRYENEQTSLGDSRRSFGFTQQFWYSPNLRIGLKAERELDGGDYDIGIRFSVPIY